MESSSTAPSSRNRSQSHNEIEKVTDDNKIEKKKKNSSSGSLPFYLFLEMDEVIPSVHPDCPDASNPYHKCGNYCLEKIHTSKNEIHHHAEGTKAKVGLRDGVHPNCKYASNPFHKCVPRCYELMRLDEQSQTNSVFLGYEAEDESSQYNAKSFAPASSRTDSFKSTDNNGANEVVHEKENREGKTTAESRILYPDCVYVSNPFHKCSDSCQQKIIEKNQQKGGLPAFKQLEKKKSWKKLLQRTNEADVDRKKNKERWTVHPDCRYASNPFHMCVEDCFKRIHETNQAKQGK